MFQHLCFEFRIFLLQAFCLIASTTYGIEVPEQQSVGILIEQLNSPKRVERANAEKKLLDLGQIALEEIEEAAKRETEVAFKLIEIAKQIRSEVASTILMGTMIEIGGEEALTLIQYASSISKQSGYQLNVAESIAQIPIQIERQRIPFWKSIDLLGKKADVGWRVFQGKIQFHPDYPLRLGSAEYLKVLRVAAIHSKQKNSFQNRTQQGLIRIQFRVDCEPPIVPYYLKLRDEDFRLLDLRSSPKILIPPFNPQSIREITPGKDSGIQFHVDFKTDEALKSDRLKLDGKLELLCAADTTEYALPLETKPDSVEPVRVIALGKSHQQLKITAEIELPDLLATFDSHRLNLLHKEAILKFSNQISVPPTERKIRYIQGNKHTVEFLFDLSERPLGEGYFVYKYPEFVTTLQTEFEITELPVLQ